MAFGRLIRVTKDRGDPSVAYIVAVSDSSAAIHLIQNKFGVGNEVEDLGRVSDALLFALHLSVGEIKILERSPF